MQNTITLANALWPAGRVSPLWRNVLLAVAGSLLLTLSAKVQVPFYPVPMTMQTFVVLVIGMAYGPRLGAATVLLYLLQGAVGLPVFAGTPERGVGLAYMAGPTAGYLLGFVVAAYFCGWLAERGWDRSVLRTAVAVGVGHVAILLLGATWLVVGLGLSVDRAYAVGVGVFWWATLFKTALAMAVLPLAWRLTRQDG